MLFAGAFISLMALTAFNSEVSAQSKNENIRYIINAVKEELANFGNATAAARSGQGKRITESQQ